MGKVFEGIDARLERWIAAQPMFFVGTAPLDGDGHVNISPKGPIESLRVLGPSRVAYLDLVGSGAETIAHLRENGRIVIMLCAFEGPPRIVRLHGRGSVVAAGEPAFDELLSSCRFDVDGVPEIRRSIVTVELDRIADSCGYGVPVMSYQGPPRAPRSVGGQAAPRRRSGRAARLPAGEERGEHRRAAGGRPPGAMPLPVTE